MLLFLLTENLHSSGLSPRLSSTNLFDENTTDDSVLKFIEPEILPFFDHHHHNLLHREA